jgi:hypothetical protein
VEEVLGVGFAAEAMGVLFDRLYDTQDGAMVCLGTVRVGRLSLGKPCSRFGSMLQPSCLKPRRNLQPSLPVASSLRERKDLRHGLFEEEEKFD